jgi:hypothetical protein
MLTTKTLLSSGLLSLIVCSGIAREAASEKPAMLWTAPQDIATRDLYYGKGGRADLPAPPFTFVKEDPDGNSPKFVVEDSKGIHWKVKVGSEAQPETVVTRFVWAVGYSTDEDYFLPEQQVDKMPKKLHRGSRFVSSDGIVHDARWERMEKKAGSWKWKKNPFSESKELNGLRVMMALFNNYDMKTSQNTIYNDDTKRQFIVGDLGATLGPTASRWPGQTPRGDVDRYAKSKFVTKVTDDYVDFAAPSWPMMFGAVPMVPLPYSILTAPFTLLGLPATANVWDQRWIGKHIARKDVQWIAGLLKQLKPNQIRDAFRAGGYDADASEEFSRVLEARIAKLTTI